MLILYFPVRFLGMSTEMTGTNAGIIWNLLNENGEHTVKELIKKLKLTQANYNMAIGWLAREEKIVLFQKDGVDMIMLK